MALSMLNFVLGCDKDKEDPAPLYGVPPDSMGGEGDIDSPTDIYEEDDVPVRTYYGPMPVDAVPLPDIDEADEVPEDTGPEPEMMPLYGMPVGDVVEDSGTTDDVAETPDVSAQDMPRTFYGPAPVDVVEDVPENTELDVMQAWYGPGPVDLTPSVDVAEDDVHEDAVSQEAMFYYGPQPGDPQ